MACQAPHRIALNETCCALQGTRLRDVVLGVATGVLLQVALAAPFLASAPGSYVSRAFEFSRCAPERSSCVAFRYRTEHHAYRVQVPALAVCSKIGISRSAQHYAFQFRRLCWKAPACSCLQVVASLMRSYFAARRSCKPQQNTSSHCEAQCAASQATPWPFTVQRSLPA